MVTILAWIYYDIIVHMEAKLWQWPSHTHHGDILVYQKERAEVMLLGMPSFRSHFQLFCKAEVSERESYAKWGWRM